MLKYDFFKLSLEKQQHRKHIAVVVVVVVTAVA